MEQKKTRKKVKKEGSSRNRKSVFSVVLVLLVTAIVLLNLFTHVLAVVHYFGNGMEPELQNGQTLILQRTKNVKEGDIVAFYYNNQLLVRRVICEGGKQITINRDGSVEINNEMLEEPYVEEPSIGQCNITFPHTVAPNHYFVMGDQRSISMDSRLKEIGGISEDRLLGKVLFAI